MKQVALLIGILVLCISCNTDSNKKKSGHKDYLKNDNRKLVFVSSENGYVSLFDYKTGITKKLVAGVNSPCISPDSKWVAYTHTSARKPHKRSIKLISTKDSIIKDLSITDKVHYGPIWSPTGEYLAFSILTNDWQIGLFNPDNNNFKIITNDSGNSLHGISWSQDGKYIFAHNLRTLYKYNTSGELVENYDLSELLTGKFYFSSNSRFLQSSDKSKLIFDSEIDDEYINREKLWRLSAIFSYDFKTKETKRISKKGLNCSSLWIGKNDLIYFSGFENETEPRKIYQTNLKDTSLIVINKGTRPSIGY